MLRKIMLLLTLIIFSVSCQVGENMYAYDNNVPLEITNLPTTEPLVSNLSVSSFLDENKYIRLNISWGDILHDSEDVFIYFSSEDCNPISDDYCALDDHFLISPSLELEHPADNILQGCVYNITLEDNASLRSQCLVYEVPECVENKCKCRDHRDSPNKLTRVTPLSDKNYFYLIAWNKTTEENCTVHDISYERKGVKHSTKSQIRFESIKYRNNAVEVPMYDIMDNVIYTIHVQFIDEFNDCIYTSSLDFKRKPKSSFRDTIRHNMIFAIGVLALIAILLVVYRILLRYPKVRNKLRKYLFFSKSYGPYENQDLDTPLALSKHREEINAQYTPLEFVLKVHKYDKFEFPRNKIILGKILGEGAFGKVLYGKAYEIGTKEGFTEVAVKQLREAASEEEIGEFQAEIDMLKRIGKHPNIVELLGCVTMDHPYLMIMELVTRGNLKDYLLNLRKKWTEKKSPRIFFPDDMDEAWLKPSSQKSPSEKMNYLKCVFDTSEGSYIKVNLDEKSQGKSLLDQKFPNTPSSMTSSRLPSPTETELTNLDAETPTPLTAEMNKLPEPVLDHTELQQFAFQIASGMLCLENLSITHRDLAARNILVTSNRVLKISDFGMSRSGLYVNRKSKKVPLRWMAVESIERLKWDSKSDVWSFGVVLWEIGTLGAFPYENVHNDLLLLELKKGNRLDRPKICTDELYSLMLRCWSENPEERPTFHELSELLDVSKRKVYVDFDQLSPKYVFPPANAFDEADEELKSDSV